MADETPQGSNSNPPGSAGGVGNVVYRHGGMHEDIRKPWFQALSLITMYVMAIGIAFEQLYVGIRSYSDWVRAGHPDLTGEQPEVSLALSVMALVAIAYGIIRLRSEIESRHPASNQRGTLATILLMCLAVFVSMVVVYNFLIIYFVWLYQYSGWTLVNLVATVSVMSGCYVGIRHFHASLLRPWEMSEGYQQLMAKHDHEVRMHDVKAEDRTLTGQLNREILELTEELRRAREYAAQLERDLAVEKSLPPSVQFVPKVAGKNFTQHGTPVVFYKPELLSMFKFITGWHRYGTARSGWAGHISQGDWRKVTAELRRHAILDDSNRPQVNQLAALKALGLDNYVAPEGIWEFSVESLSASANETDTDTHAEAKGDNGQ